MKKGVIKFFIVIIILIIILIIGKVIIDGNLVNVKNFDLFEADNEYYYRLEVEPVYDGGGIEYYNIDLLNKEVGHYKNSGMINNKIELINKKTLTEQEVTRLKELFKNASETYVKQSEISNYYKISNGKYIYSFEEVQELEQILGK